jgi:hypothetical protein
MPTSAREFFKAALHRLTAAVFLQERGYDLDAMYLAGYGIECSLKALILESTPQVHRTKMLAQITSGASMHRAETLAPILKSLGCPIPLNLVKQFRRYGWSTAMRYESGRRRSGEVRGFLKTVRATINWVEGQLP